MAELHKTLRFSAIIVGAGFQFLATLYIARITGVEGFGEYILQLVAMQFIVSFSVGGGTLFWFRERAKFEPYAIEHRLMATVSLGLALAFSVVGAALFAWENESVLVSSETLAYLPLYLIVHLAHTAYAEARFLQVRTETIAICIWFAGRQCLLMLLFFLYDTNDWNVSLLLLNMISYWVMLPFMIYLPWKPVADRRGVVAVVKEWWMVNMTTVSSQLFTTLDVYVVRFIAGESAVGIYSYVSRLLRPQLLLHKSLTLYYNRPLAQHVAADKFKHGYRLVRKIGLYSGAGATVLGLVVVGFLLAFDPEIHRLISVEFSFTMISVFVITMFLSNVLNCSFGPNAMYMVMARLSHVSTVINLIGFGAFVLLSLIYSNIFAVVEIAIPVSLLCTWLIVNILRERRLLHHAKFH
jgi:O-antigen/teichoic acid export membrane protein